MGRDLLPTPYFVTSEVIFDPAIEVTVGHPGTMQHDALTLSAALQLPFVEFDKMPVAVDGVGRTTRSGTGVPVRVSLSARCPAFMRRLSQRLDPAWKPAAEGA